MKNISFRAHFQENLSSPFRTSNFFFFHFLLYCKRKEYICLIHEKSFIKITTMNIEPHNLIDPLREKLPHLIRHEKQYRMIHRQLMKKWFQYFVLFFIIGSICPIIYSSFEESAPYHNILYAFNYLASPSNMDYASWLLPCSMPVATMPGKHVCATCSPFMVLSTSWQLSRSW